MTMATSYGAKTRILLSGSLAKLFGREHNYELSTGDVREAVKAIDVNRPGFAKYLADARMLGFEFAIFRNRRNVGEVELDLGGAREIRIVPVICGSKRAGSLQTIIGVVLIIAATIATGGVGGFAAGGAWGAVGAAGASMAIGGVIQMLSPQASGLKNSAAPENTPGYAFGSAKNTTASGNPVPLCIGHRRWGGAIISAGIYAEDRV
ncbi:tail assembly protein [Pseudomonas sp. B21-053]|uniref:tail assembly protein n=1 Tax=Pseudomonas sp. B21-053 TaxID=2895493 RepID=UPI0022301290|nr:tail assembly protein [Pseudomonas sp. B21-053]UZE10544.1 tail assembly protein [Pseudomonas sp. B21-053]